MVYIVRIMAYIVRIIHGIAVEFSNAKLLHQNVFFTHRKLYYREMFDLNKTNHW